MVHNQDGQIVLLPKLLEGFEGTVIIGVDPISGPHRAHLFEDINDDQAAFGVLIHPGFQAFQKVLSQILLRRS
jgi:hypothetical protein